MAQPDVIYFILGGVVKCTVQSEIHTAAVSHEFIGFAEIEQRVIQINTGMGSFFQQQLQYLSSIHSKISSKREGVHGTALCTGSLEVPNPATVHLFSERTVLSHSRKLSF